MNWDAGLFFSLKNTVEAGKKKKAGMEIERYMPMWGPSPSSCDINRLPLR